MSEEATAYEFPSLSVLKQAHLKLLADEAVAAEPAEKRGAFLEDVGEFMLRTRATGRILEDDKERGIAQTLLNYWATVLFRSGMPEDRVPQTSLLDLDESAGRDLDESQCPYCGLQAYTEENSHLFFGRKHVVDKWLEILAGPKLILVVLGPSGAGKTSLVRAGLLPALRSTGEPGWRIREATLQKPESAEEILAPLREDAGEQPELLVLHRLDEGLLSCDRKMQRKLIAAFKVWLGEPGRKRKAVLVSRAESAALVGQWLRDGDLTEKSEQVFIPPFEARELRAVIEAPAERVGLRFDEGLVDTLVNEFLGDPAALALLQFVLLKLWDARDRNRITWTAYHAMGGGQRAVETTADGIYLGEDFSEAERELTKKIFLRLVRPTLTSALAVNRVPESALMPGTELNASVGKIVERFTAARLLRVEADEQGERQVEVVQEALLRKWPRFLLWLEDARQELLERRRISDAAAQWREGGRHRSALWTGILLERAWALYDQLSPDEREFVFKSRRAVRRRYARVFVALSALLLLLSVLSARAYYKWRETKAALNTERGEHLLEISDPAGAFLFFNQANNDDPSHQMSLRFRAWRWLISPFGPARYPAEAQEKLNQFRLGAAFWQLPRLEQLVYLQDLTRSVLSPDGKYLAGASGKELSLWHLIAPGKAEGSNPLLQHPHAQVSWISFSRNPKRPLLAVALDTKETGGKPRGEVLVLDPRTQQTVGRPIEFPSGVPQKVWFNPQDEEQLLIIAQPAAGAPVVGIWNYGTGSQQAVSPPQSLPVNWAAFSPDGELVVIATGVLQGGEEGGATIWDWKNDRSVPWPTDGPLAYAEFDAAGNRVVTSEGADAATRGAARVWKIQRAGPDRPALAVEAVTAPLPHRGAVTRARFSPDGLWVASAGRDRTTRLWHIRTGKEILRFEQGGDVNDVVFSPDGRFLASGGRDRTARIWEIATGQPVSVFHHSETVGWVAFSDDGRSLVTSTKGLAQIWSADRTEPKRPIIPAEDSVVTAISGDGQHLLTVKGGDSVLQIWETLSGKLIAEQTLDQHERVRFAALDREGKRGCLLVSGRPGTNQQLRVFQVDAKAKQTTDLAIFEDEAIRQSDLVAAEFAEGARHRIALIAQNKNETTNSVFLVELGAKSLRLLPQPDAASFTRVHFSPKGTYLLACFTQPSAAEGRAEIWRLDREPAVRFELAHESQITTADFSPDEKFILTGSTDDSAKFWQIQTSGVSEGTVLGAAGASTHTADLTCVRFSPDGRRALTAAKDQTAILWAMPEAGAPSRRIAVLNHDASVNDAVFSADSARVLTLSGEPKLRAWSALTGELLGLFQPAGETVQAGFTPDSKSAFAIVQNVVSRGASSPDEPDSAYEIRPMSWTFERLPLDAEAREKIGAVLSARELAHAELASTQTALNKAKTDLLPQLWRDQAEPYAKLFPRPLDAEAFHLAAANECEATREYGAAAWHLTQLLESGPRSVKLLLRRADDYARADNFEESLPRCIADHQEAIGLGKNGAADYAALAEAHLSYGNTFAKAGDGFGQWEAAIEAYRQAASLAPDDADYAIGLGDALAGERRFSEAATEYQRVLQRGDNSSALAHLAMVNWLRGDELGKKQYRDLCLTLKDSASPRTLLWPAVASNTFEQDQEFRELMVKRAQDSLNEAPGNFYRRNTLGAALYRAGHYEKAIQELERARASGAAGRANSLSQRYDHTIRAPISAAPDGRPLDWVFLAMANAKFAQQNLQSNPRNSAWDWIRKLREAPELAQSATLQNSGPAAERKPRTYPTLYDNLALEMLYDEAFGVLRQAAVGAPSPTPPVAPPPAR